MDLFERTFNKILSKEISPDDAVHWLSSSNVPNEDFQGKNRVDFANFFLAYLREKTSFLESRSSITPSNTPIKSLGKPLAPHPDADLVAKKPQERRSCSRKLPLNGENKIELSTECIENVSRRNANHSHPRPGPHAITLGNFVVTKTTSQRERKNARASIKLNSFDEFPEIGVTKRVKPIMISSQNEIKVQDKVPNAFTGAPEVSASDVVLERARLKLECIKVQNNNLKATYELPVRDAKEQLETLSKIYAAILNSDLELNIMNEVYFLTELLCVNIRAEDEQHEIFGNSSNCAYFSAKTFGSLGDTLKHLDPGVVKLLVENSKMNKVCPDVVAELKEVLVSLQCRPTISLILVIGSQVESESKENFATPDSFQVYRRQRDGFYALMEDWDNERHFSKKLAKEVLDIFELNTVEPENLAYFCRLFVSQLICSCIGDGSDGSNKAPFDFRVDPERLKRLHQRLVTPSKALAGPCPLPDFSGWEEFFRDFIVIASNANFNQHLQDSLLSTLRALDGKKFELQSNVEEETRHKILACVVSAQLVAKFLGFVEFRPYKSPLKRAPEQVLSAQVLIREKVRLPIDTYQLIATSEKNGRLILTVPWLCSYLVQLDAVSIRLPDIQATISFLISLQRGLSSRSLSGTTKILLRLNIGWCLSILAELCPSVWDMFRSAAKIDVQENSNSLDTIDMMDSRSITLIFPFVLELRSILAGNPGNVRSGQAVGPKHIKPVAAITVDPVLHLELQLEASFVQTQPSSVRQTLEFVTERLYALCIDHLQDDTVKSALHDLESKVQEKVRTEADSLDPQLDFSQLKSALMNGLASWSVIEADKQSETMSQKCLNEANKFLGSRCSSLLSHLLPQSVTQIQCSAFAQIVIKNICSKIKVWIQTTYGSTEMLKKTKESLEKAAKHRAKSGEISTVKTDPNVSLRLPAERRGLEHLETVTPPAELMLQYREILFKLSNGQEISRDGIENLITATELVVLHREDLIPVAVFMIKPLTVDLAMFLAVYSPQILTNSVVSKLVGLWKGPFGRPDQLEKIFSPKHMHMLSLSKNQNNTWSAFGRFLHGLVKAGLLSPMDIEEQAVGVLQLQWPPEFLEMYSLCINNLVRENGAKPESDENSSFSELLPWLADYCSNLDELPVD
ncbi:codanin-1 [Neocloeon triangulifer]|uniref:codanin-1 n=1 Tax=Neocloeon triangulifer TaxID=2078957 RepID=UPI00286ECD5E|nr:codanin-1 [Neocloeon triangulifer]